MQRRSARGRHRLRGISSINNAADATAAQAYSGIAGSLVIGVGFAGAVDLPRLRTVGGDVYAEGGGITNLRART